MLAVWPGVFPAGERTPALVSTVDLLPTLLDAAGLTIPEGLHGRSLRHTLESAGHREFLATEFHFHGPTPFYPRRSIRDARYKLIHNLRAGEAKPTTGIDGDAAYLMGQKPPYAGNRVGIAFERAANPPEFELYDLQADPWEFNDLAAAPAHAAALARMQQALLDWRRSTNDPLLEPAGFAAMAAREMPNTPKAPAKKKKKPAAK
jgi:N-sulfoglucosamine sulfohydrolase